MSILANITAVASFVPEEILNNSDLEKLVETNDEWIVSRTGIKERRVLRDKDRSTVFMGVQIVNEILNRSKLSPSEIDMVVVGTCTADYIMPGAAQMIITQSGLTRAYGFDVAAYCSGFIYSLEIGKQFIESGKHRNIIVLGVDNLTRYVDYNDRATCILFGDGGGGVLLEAQEGTMGLIDTVMHSDGCGSEALTIKMGGALHPCNHNSPDPGKQYIYQEGRSVFKKAVNGMKDSINELLVRNNLDKSDINWLIPHQANMRIIDSIIEHLDYPREKVVVNIEKYGNTSAGTIPICLDEFQHQFKKGDKIMLTAFGGGFTWGAVYLRWGI